MYKELKQRSCCCCRRGFRKLPNIARLNVEIWKRSASYNHYGWITLGSSHFSNSLIFFSSAADFLNNFIACTLRPANRRRG